MQKITLIISTFILLFSVSCKSPVTEEKIEIPQRVDEVPRIDPAALHSRIEAGETLTIVDVRSRESYNSEHIPGAIHIPGSEVSSRLAEFPTTNDIILYCT